MAVAAAAAVMEAAATPVGGLRRRLDTAGEAQVVPPREPPAAAAAAAGSAAAKGKGGGKGARTRRGAGGEGGRRRKGDGRSRQITTRDPGLRELLQSLCMITHQTSARTRALMGSIYDCWLIPADHVIVKRMQEQLRAFMTQVTTWRRERDEAIANGDEPQPAWGNPAPMIYMEFLEALSEQSVGENNSILIQQHPEQMNAATGPQEIELIVPTCRVDLIETAGTARITISLNRAQARLHIVNAMAQLQNVVYKSGGPPPGYLEDDISMWIEALRDQQQ